MDENITGVPNRTVSSIVPTNLAGVLFSDLILLTIPKIIKAKKQITSAHITGVPVPTS